MKRILPVLVFFLCCTMLPFNIGGFSLGSTSEAEAATKAAVWVSTDARLIGSGSDSVNQLSVDLPSALRKALTKAGYQVVLTEDKPHDLVARLQVNTDLTYAVFDAWVVFKKATLLLEQDGSELATFQYLSDKSGGHFKSYGPDGERYAVEAADALIAQVESSPVMTSYLKRRAEAAIPPPQPPVQAPAPAPVVAADTAPPVIMLSSPQITRGVKFVAKESYLAIAGTATDDSGIAAVLVNGQPIAFDKTGKFSSNLLLKPGDTVLTITAVDKRNNVATETFTIGMEAVAKVDTPVVAAPPAAAATAAPAAASAPVQGRSHALVIGINQYQNMDRLRTAVGDATDVAQVLKDVYGFQTRLILDNQATRVAILKELNELKNELNPEDRLLIYYAGHGYNDKETETSYWLPVEADKNDPTNWIEARSITDQLKRTRAKQVLVVSDSCYSGTMARAIDPSLEGRGTRESYLQKLMEKPSRVLIASGGNEPVTDAGGKGHSIFAEVFINALVNPSDAVFTAEELLTRQIKERVAGRAEQTPEYKIIRNSGHDGGDFVFVKPAKK